MDFGFDVLSQLTISEPGMPIPINELKFHGTDEFSRGYVRSELKLS
jgi:hypothetical protein